MPTTLEQRIERALRDEFGTTNIFIPKATLANAREKYRHSDDIPDRLMKCVLAALSDALSDASEDAQEKDAEKSVTDTPHLDIAFRDGSHAFIPVRIHNVCQIELEIKGGGDDSEARAFSNSFVKGEPAPCVSVLPCIIL
uniref:Uncharacterized protein n=1 Tax=Candidatus Kentrum sp. LPFa TaxID=2126335 RepID=A0A450WD70_9GAMM|nr:MAG: hypothetical protein BECKLPF1236B_GA0070989_10718 [Candidatus Kentron sp. LPFa]